MALGGMDLVGMHASATPDRVAVVEGERSWTWAELDRAATGYAKALRALGAEPGDRVVWCGQNGLEVVAVIDAGPKAGIVSVPLNYRLTSDEAAYVIDDSDATVVVFDAEQADQLAAGPKMCSKVRAWASFRGTSPEWAHDLDAVAADEDPTTPVDLGAGFDAGAGGSMIYTSGTTGRPKGALRRGMGNAAVGAALVAHIGFEPGEVYLTTGPLYHSGPLGFMVVAQLLGGTVIVQRQFEPEEWLALVERHQVASTFAAPTPMRRVLDLPDERRSAYDYSSMRRFVANAAPWPFDLKRRYVEAFGGTSLWEVYGSTELAVNTVLRPEDQMRKPGSCGQAAPLVELALFDDDGQRVIEPGAPGELFVRSGASFDTYHKAEDAFDESRRDDWLTVGDIAYIDDEGFYFICDRKKDMIISGGMNIYPAEIEAALVAHPGVADAAVFGVPSEEWGEAVHAVVATYPDRPVTDADLDAHCREHLASYKLPRSWDRIEEIPRTASGKILKRELRAPHWDDAD